MNPKDTLLRGWRREDCSGMKNYVDHDQLFNYEYMWRVTGDFTNLRHDLKIIISDL